MLRKRVIFTLIYSEGFFMQSRNFRLQKVGDIDWLEKNYGFQDISFSIDELIVLDASRNKRNINGFSKILSRLAENVFIPISAGGGIQSIDHAMILFNNGADKVVLNSALFNDKPLVQKIINKYGSQSVLASVDYRGDEVFINNNDQKLEIKLLEYIKKIQSYGVGEIYLNSIEKDGTGFGYDKETIAMISKIIEIPLIIAGGAGNAKHLLECIFIDKVDAVATANLFNFIGDGLPKARKMIIDQNGNIPNWT
jgi:imidazole glycerol-phosphate synthase subunit HisF